MTKKYEYYMKRLNLGLLKKPEKHQEEFNKLGKEGWELIAVVPIAEPVAFTSVPITKAVLAYFKRELRK
jgi:hypothetical protein